MRESLANYGGPQDHGMSLFRYDRARWVVALVGTALLVLIGVFPPWDLVAPRCSDAGCVVLHHPMGHGFILSPPSGWPHSGRYDRGYQLDIRRWAVESSTVVLVVFGLMIGLGGLAPPGIPRPNECGGDASATGRPGDQDDRDSQRAASGAVRTQEELFDASTKVAYELTMIARTANILMRKPRSASQSEEAQVIYNALVHCFLLGVRNLYEFFWGADRDGIHAKAFVEPRKWTAKKPIFRKGHHWTPIGNARDSSDGENLIQLIQTRLAHLSWKRVSEGKIQWGVGPIAAGFLSPFSTFANQARAGCLSPDFLGAVQELDAIVQAAGIVPLEAR